MSRREVLKEEQALVTHRGNGYLLALVILLDLIGGLDENHCPGRA